MTRLLAKHWAIALLVSLALNLFLGGMFATRWLRGPRGVPSHGKHHLRFDALRDALGPEAEAAIDQVDAKHGPTIKTSIDEMREARRAAMTALSAEPFDETKARQAHAELVAKELAARQAMHEALVELAAALPPAERAKLGKAMRKRGRRGPPKHGKDRRHRDAAEPGGEQPAAEQPPLEQPPVE